MTKKATRTFNFRAEQDGDKPVRIAISSDEPYLLKFGWQYGLDEVYEVLGHKEGEVDLSYMIEGAPLAVDHDVRDQVGVLENVTVDADGKMRADVRFSQSTRGKEIEQDVIDGIRTRISVGYQVKDFEMVSEEDDKIPSVRATNWTPYEASLVAIPADLTVGVGRDLEEDDEPENGGDLSVVEEEKEDEFELEIEEEDEEEETKATDEDEDDEVEEEVVEEKEDDADEDDEKEDEDEEEKEVEVDEDEEEKELEDSDDEDLEDEEEKHIIVATNKGARAMKRFSQLARIANEYNKTSDLPKWIDDDRSVESVMDEILDERSNAHSVEQPILNEREQNEFSVIAAVEAISAGENSLVNEIGLERAKAAGMTIKKDAIYIPLNVPMFESKRTYLQGSGDGASAIGMNYISFEDALRNESIIGQLGVQVQEFSDQVTMPYAGGATPSWIGENGEVTATSGSVDTLTWTPKACALDVPYTRQLRQLDGTYSIESIVRRDILGALQEASETAVFQGSGSNEPLGIEFDDNIFNVSAHANEVTYNDFTQMQASQSIAKGAQSNRFWVMPPALYATGLTKPRLQKDFTTSYVSGSVFEDTNYVIAGPSLIEDGMIAGDLVISSNFVTATSATIQKVVYGNFQQVLLAHFGVLEIVVNPYRQSNFRRIVLEGTLLMDSKARRHGDLIVHDGLSSTA